MKESIFQLKSSISIYKQMVYERDIKIQELQDKLLNTNDTMNESTYDGILMTLSQNANMIKNLASGKPSKNTDNSAKKTVQI